MNNEWTKLFFAWGCTSYVVFFFFVVLFYCTWDTFALWTPSHCEFLGGVSEFWVHNVPPIKYCSVIYTAFQRKCLSEFECCHGAVCCIFMPEEVAGWCSAAREEFHYYPEWIKVLFREAKTKAILIYLLPVVIPNQFICVGYTGQLVVGTCEIVMLNRDSSQPKRTIARQTARCACRRGQIAGTTRARPACVDGKDVSERRGHCYQLTYSSQT